MRKKITIEVEEYITGDLADILCYFAGLFDSKGEDWKNIWIMDSVNSLKDLKINIQEELKK